MHWKRLSVDCCGRRKRLPGQCSTPKTEEPHEHLSYKGAALRRKSAVQEVNNARCCYTVTCSLCWSCLMTLWTQIWSIMWCVCTHRHILLFYSNKDFPHKVLDSNIQLKCACDIHTYSIDSTLRDLITYGLLPTATNILRSVNHQIGLCANVLLTSQVLHTALYLATFTSL